VDRQNVFSYLSTRNKNTGADQVGRILFLFLKRIELKISALFAKRGSKCTISRWLQKAAQTRIFTFVFNLDAPEFTIDKKYEKTELHV
jgi:hypothetical protein